MENLQGYKDQIKKLELMITKLEKGELTLDDITALEELTRAIHERSIILKYKAFEDNVKARSNPDEKIEINTEEEDFPQNEEPAIDFSIFEDSIDDTTESAEEENNEEFVEVVVEIEELEDEPEEEDDEEAAIEEKLEGSESSNGDSFLDLLNLDDNSLSSQFEGSKIETLIGAFGLNQKLRFINELFDGSSESFSEAIKVLDKLNDFDEAKNTAAEIANEHEWDPEEESVVEFMTMISRRYA